MRMRTCPALTGSPDFTKILVRLPLTCGCMVEERRLLIVATYVSVVGTGENVTGATMTGMAWGGAAGGGAALQPANRTAMAAPAREGNTRGVFGKTDQVFFLTS